jgi:hypothetical protein
MVDGTHRCIVTAIANYTMRASNVELKSEERAEAIKFLIHLIGDIHNPVHVGFAEDFGGNLIHLSEPAGKSLHDVWDFSLVNRKQVEHGVYKEMEEDEAEPWKLSDSLLEQFTDKQSLYPFMLNVKLEDVSSEESATRLAAGMASRTARDFTCNVAYRNENDQWIESGDSLSDEYMSSRSLHAMEMLKLAGIRLAEMINMISRQYSVNKRAAASSGSTKVDQKPEFYRGAQHANRYRVLVIDIDFDPEELLFDEEMVDQTSANSLTEKGVVPEVVIGDEKVSKSQKRKMRKARAKRMFEGVDLESVVLIKRLDFYIVTGSDLVTPEYFPAQVDPYRVRFSDDNEVVLNFDVAHFGSKEYSNELIERSLMKIKKIEKNSDQKNPVSRILSSDTEEDEFFSSSLSFERVNGKFAPLSGEFSIEGKPHRVVYTLSGEEYAKNAAELIFKNLHKIGSNSAKKKEKKLRKKENQQWMDVLGYVPSPREISEFAIRKSFNSICVIQVEQIVFFAHKQSLEDKSIPMIKASMYNVIAPQEGQYLIMLVDMLIVEGEMAEKVGELLMEASSLNRKSCDSSFAKRPSIIHELHDIQTLMFKQETDRVDSFRRIQYLFIVPAGKGDVYHHIHWSIHQELSEQKLIL